jgi:hypothetical protein
MNLKLLLAAGAVVAAIAAGVSYAAIPGANGTISACVKQNGEIQKLVDTEAGETCTGSNKHLVTWNQQGPAGPAGPQGATGPHGPAGPATPIGAVNIQGDGTLFNWMGSQRSVVSATRTSVGHYQITFNQTVALCSRWTSTTVAARTFAMGHLNDNAVMAVSSYDATGAAVDTSFTLYISCPS